MKMRTALLAGTLLVAFAGSSFAQMPPGQQGDQGYGPPQHMWRGMHEEGGPWGVMGRHFGHEHMQAMMAVIGALSSGTFYRFRRGSDEVDIHCPARLALQDCVEGATTLMKQLPQSGTSTPATPGHP